MVIWAIDEWNERNSSAKFLPGISGKSIARFDSAISFTVDKTIGPLIIHNCMNDSNSGVFSMVMFSLITFCLQVRS